MPDYILYKIKGNLQAKLAGKNAATYAQAYRVLPSGKWGFYGREYLLPIHTSKARRICAPKGAQMGFTEAMINIAFYGLDVKKLDTLYIFPTAEDSSAFSAGRFATALDLSPRLKELFTDVNNVKHKKAGIVNFYCRGSNSRAGLKSIPVARLFFDEFDEILPEMIPLGRERLSGADDFFEMDISTPTIPDFGIMQEFDNSKQHYWFVKCLHCGHKQMIEWPDSVQFIEKPVLDAWLICLKCKKKWPHERKKELISSSNYEVVKNAHVDHEGYSVSQLYSCSLAAHPKEIVRLSLRTEEHHKVELYNSKLGRPYIPEGSVVTREMVRQCFQSYKPDTRAISACMGVDVSAVGRHFVTIGNPDNHGFPIIMTFGLYTWKELGSLMQTYNIRCCVIDAQPERSKARDFSDTFETRVFMAFYPEGLKIEYKANEENRNISIDRSEAIEKLHNRIRNEQIAFPNQTYCKDQLVDHCTALVKTYRKDKSGLMKPRYLTTGADHFAHSLIYLSTAMTISPIAGTDFVLESGNFLR